MSITSYIKEREKEFEKGKWWFCYENGVMTGIQGERMLEANAFHRASLIGLMGEIEKMVKSKQIWKIKGDPDKGVAQRRGAYNKCATDILQDLQAIRRELS